MVLEERHQSLFSGVADAAVLECSSRVGGMAVPLSVRPHGQRVTGVWFLRPETRRNKKSQFAVLFYRYRNPRAHG